MSFTHNLTLHQNGKREILQLIRFERLTCMRIYYIRQANLKPDYKWNNVFTRSSISYSELVLKSH